MFVASTGAAASSGSNPITAAFPAGVTAAHYQLVIAYIVSSSPTFPTPPDGWNKILDQAITYPDSATSTGRLGLFEMDNTHVDHGTLFDDAFSISASSARVWQTIRAAYSNAIRVGSPLYTFTPLGTSHAVPLTDVAVGNSKVLAIGASEKDSAGTSWGWTALGAATSRRIVLPSNSIESSSIALGDIAVATPTDDVTANFTLSSSQRGNMVSLVLQGAA